MGWSLVMWRRRRGDGCSASCCWPRWGRPSWCWRCLGSLAHEVARRTLEEELGRAAGRGGGGAALLVLPEQIRAVGAGDEALLPTRGCGPAWSGPSTALGVRRVALVARDLTGRGDTAGGRRWGRWRTSSRADAVEIERAAAGGQTAASPLFVGQRRRPTSGPTPRWVPPGDVAGFVVVEASADYLAALAAFRGAG